MIRTEAEIKKIAIRLMNKHGLIETGWKLKRYHSTDRYLGQCRHDEKTIRLNRIGAAINTLELLEDTILHEIAHALVGFMAFHGPIWQAKAIELGARPSHCVGPDYVMPPPKPRLIRRYRIPADVPEIGGE